MRRRGKRTVSPAEGATAAAIPVIVVMAVVAGTLSGVPSTAWALATGGDPLAGARAAGNLLVPATAPSRRLLVAGAVAHVALSTFWAGVLAWALPRRRTVMWGAVAGAGIAALDLGVVARRAPLPLIRALPAGPQVADHVAFGALAGAVAAARREDRRGRKP